MFGTLVFELFHLGSRIPYQDLSDDDVLEFYREFWSNSKQNSIEPSVVCLPKYFPRPSLCNDRLYALIERCLSWSNFDRPSVREIMLCLDETTASPLVSLISHWPLTEQSRKDNIKRKEKISLHQYVLLLLLTVCLKIYLSISLSVVTEQQSVKHLSALVKN